MYSTCLFCNKPLGNNEVLEDFPVGRRIAFDGATGRLWVVCRSCERWNLSPLDERWEIIEACERLFSMERKRVSTENIGLAKLNEGLELVRIGSPQRPEFAAWRYGDQFGRRRKRNALIAGAGVAVVAGVYAIGWVAGGATIMMFNGGGGLIRRAVSGNPNKIIVRHPEGDIKRKHLDNMVLRPHETEGYSLVLTRRKHTMELMGEEARKVLQVAMPAINRFGGQQRQIKSAVEMIERARDPGDFLKIAARDFSSMRVMQKSGTLGKLPRDVRLALEMAVHEDAERRALEGELKELELAWREAEEIAAISDSLLTSNFITSALEKLKGK